MKFIIASQSGINLYIVKHDSNYGFMSYDLRRLLFHMKANMVTHLTAPERIVFEQEFDTKTEIIKFIKHTYPEELI